ncbi:hypothetical protein EGY31_10545 [Burkholderia multivorans]|nr:hypothetical protein EGY31_10545 [Burkholderia multivorans]
MEDAQGNLLACRPEGRAYICGTSPSRDKDPDDLPDGVGRGAFIPSSRIYGGAAGRSVVAVSSLPASMA